MAIKDNEARRKDGQEMEMNCAICKNELETDEMGDGSIRFSCPLCGPRQMSAGPPKREVPIPGISIDGALRYGFNLIHASEKDD